MTEVTPWDCTPNTDSTCEGDDLFLTSIQTCTKWFQIGVHRLDFCQITQNVNACFVIGKNATKAKEIYKIWKMIEHRAK